ncbi:hypothetical protein LX36DRAFT_127311 [Colletotrichum falcatum]|nr:hypothetical protein LX36DRAFT_127311 [Colletotrichum falcatum]
MDSTVDDRRKAAKGPVNMQHVDRPVLWSRTTAERRRLDERPGREREVGGVPVFPFLPLPPSLSLSLSLSLCLSLRLSVSPSLTLSLFPRSLDTTRSLRNNWPTRPAVACLLLSSATLTICQSRVRRGSDLLASPLSISVPKNLSSASRQLPKHTYPPNQTAHHEIRPEWNGDNDGREIIHA